MSTATPSPQSPEFPKASAKLPRRISLSSDSDATIDVGLSTSATARRLLEERGFRMSSRGFDRSYALHWAAREGEAAIVRMLLQLFHGAELEPPVDRPAKKRRGCYDWASDGWTPLHSAASHGHAAVVSLLLDYHLEHGTGIEINSATSHGWTPLHWAARNGHMDVVRVLLRRGADPLLKSKAGHTPVEWALLSSHQAVADLLRWFVAKSRKRIKAAE